MIVEIAEANGFNRLKTLSGIETAILGVVAAPSASLALPASTDSKPFQGLKHTLWHKH